MLSSHHLPEESLCCRNVSFSTEHEFYRLPLFIRRAAVFTLTTEQFAQLKSGDQITLGYGSGERQAWRVGRLNKSQLEQ